MSIAYFDAVLIQGYDLFETFGDEIDISTGLTSVTRHHLIGRKARINAEEFTRKIKTRSSQ